MINRIVVVGLMLISNFMIAQTTIDVQPNYKHRIDGVETFDRSVFVQIHADITESDWTGWNFEDFVDLRDTFLNGLDVYMGRNTGGISFQFSQVTEDPNRPGFADPVNMVNRGQNTRNNYANNSNWHPYESRTNLIIGAQQHPFYPDGTPTGQGWVPANGTAVGEFMGRYVNNFFGENGQPAPPLVEIMNEPLYELMMEGHMPTEIFQFHNEAADAIREQNSEVLIGGYTTAFPNFEENNFQRWEDRWKLFMDMSGDKMDFWSIHLYDFNSLWDGGFTLRRGSNMEATMDMMEHYSKLSFDEVKPFVLSEYGGRALDLEPGPWTPFRDWQTMKSMTPMLLSFMERPQHILSAIPFIIVKAEWGRQSNGNPYPWRLMRKNNELPGSTGSYWVYTEMVKFYQLWSDVKGTRIDTKSSNPDIQINAFADGNKLYLVAANLESQPQDLDLNMLDMNGNAIQNVRVKHLYLNAAGDAPLLTENNFDALPAIEIASEGAMVIEYTFENDVLIDELVEEEKYYANEQLTPIVPNARHEFNINEVTTAEYGEAVLRLGIGRALGKNLTPVVTINGKTIEVPENYRGYDQSSRPSWFGVIDIPVPYAHLQNNNKVTVQFPDADGHISSATLRVFNQSQPIVRTDAISTESISLTPTSKELQIGQEYTLTATISPVTATEQSVEWNSTNEAVATVDDQGKVTAVALGQTTITATSVDGNLTATSTIEVVTNAAIVDVSSINVNPATFEMGPTELLQMTADIFPIDASDPSVSWSVSNPDLATIDNNGLLTAMIPGIVEVIGTTSDGELSDTSFVEIISQFAVFVRCNFLTTQVESNTSIPIEIDYSAGYALDISMELINAEGTVVSQGQSTVAVGIGTATIILESTSFPEPGTGYTLRAAIRSVGGDVSTNLDECTKANVTVTENTTGTIPVELANFNLYPNPTTGNLYLELPDLQGAALIRIFDVYGRLVVSGTTTEKQSQYEIGKFAAGLYLVKIENKSGSITKRIIKN